MNLLVDPWMPIVRRDGTEEKISIWEILDGYDKNPVVDIQTPRADLRNALYQLLIGIIQVSALPDDDEDWADLLEKPYSTDEFKTKLLAYSDCFEINSAGPAFMQDYDKKELDGQKGSVGISKLLISTPGTNAEKLNTDFFIKRDDEYAIDAYWAAISLYTLQTYAPSGGSGHRVGVRGGGPLSVIIQVVDESATLWQNLWVNILSNEAIQGERLPGNLELTDKSDIFPWMKETKKSANDVALLPDECNPFHVYFAMPRRIRLDCEFSHGVCSLTDAESSSLVSSYKTYKEGNNYNGNWLHPLNSYNISDPEKPPISMKGQPDGIIYKNWLGISHGTDEVVTATVVSEAKGSEIRKEIFTQLNTKLWIAGYDMDNMKARNWYESSVPVYFIEKEKDLILSQILQQILQHTEKFAGNISSKIKEAWFKDTKDVKGDTAFIKVSFYNKSETRFYQMLDELVSNIDDRSAIAEIIEGWQKYVIDLGLAIFDELVLQQQEEGLNMKRIVKARANLDKSAKSLRKNLNNLINIE